MRFIFSVALFFVVIFNLITNWGYENHLKDDKELQELELNEKARTVTFLSLQTNGKLSGKVSLKLEFNTFHSEKTYCLYVTALYRVQ
jgi:hypothetical protein